MNKAHPKIKIHRLREIGWSLWDPIGLSGSLGDWKGSSFEDEYDTYLLKAAGMLRNKCSASEVIDYLYFIETEYIGMGKGSDEARHRKNLSKVVQAISEDATVWSDGFTN